MALNIPSLRSSKNASGEKLLSGLGFREAKTSPEKSRDEKINGILLIVLRVIIIINAAVMFFPAFNPARISAMIGKNLSLFTCGISYDSLVQSFGRAFMKGWVSEGTFRFLFASCLIYIISAAVTVAGGCMSLGNNKLKRLALKLSAGGGAGGVLSMIGVYAAYQMVSGTSNPDKIQPALPGSFAFYVIASIAVAALSAVTLMRLPQTEKGEKYEIEDKYSLFLMLLPILLLTFLFSYLPLFGWRYAFYDYKAGESLTAESFVGFKWFTQLFQNSATKKDILRVIKNTLAMSGMGIITSWVPMMFAVLLSEIKNNRFRRFVQTFTTIPNFISWVLVYAIALAIFSTDGFVNTMLTSLGNPTDTNYLMSSSHMWLKMLAWGLWKSLGWNAIIYMAAISGIDQGLYEAATVDGAGRFAKMWYITIPELIPTYMVLLLMSVANILTNGMDQYLVFSNPVNKNAIEVLDLYVYNLGIGNGLIPLSTVIGMVKSVISVILLFAANGISKLIRGESIV